MTTATIREVQHNLARVLRSVEAGGEVLIRRRSRTIAKIVPVTSADERAADWSSLGTWRARVFGQGRLPGKPISDIISEGRGE